MKLPASLKHQSFIEKRKGRKRRRWQGRERQRKVSPNVVNDVFLKRIVYYIDVVIINDIICVKTLPLMSKYNESGTMIVY